MIVRVFILIMTSFMLTGCSGKSAMWVARLSEVCAEILLPQANCQEMPKTAIAAVGYLQDVLEDFPKSHKDGELRSRIMLQTAHLLMSMNLYKEALPYIEEVMDFFSEKEDTINTVGTLHELGGAYFHSGGLFKAEKCFYRALNLSRRFSPKHSAESRMYLGEVKHRLGEIDSALFYIRHTPEEVSSQARNSALAYASRIYLDAGIPDTAYVYSCELLRSGDAHYCRRAYEVILDPRLRAYMPRDSVDVYVNRYKDVLESVYAEDRSQLAMRQEDLYNEISEHRRANASFWNSASGFWPRWVIIMLFAVGATSMFFVFRKRNRLRHTPTEACVADYSTDDMTAVSERDNAEEMRRSLRKRLLAEAENGTETMLNPIIAQSKAYGDVQLLIREGRSVLFEDSLWTDLEAAVLAASPDFRTRIQILTGNRFTAVDYHTALMIKCHIAPTQMANLTGRSKGAIMSRREALCSKIYDRNPGTRIFDAVIRRL